MWGISFSQIKLAALLPLIPPILISFGTRLPFPILLPFAIFLSFSSFLPIPSFLARLSVFQLQWLMLVSPCVTHGDPKTTYVRVSFPVRPTHGFVHDLAVLPSGARFRRDRRTAWSIILQLKGAPVFLGQRALCLGKTAAVLVRFIIRATHGSIVGRTFLGTRFGRPSIATRT